MYASQKLYNLVVICKNASESGVLLRVDVEDTYGIII